MATDPEEAGAAPAQTTAVAVQDAHEAIVDIGRILQSEEPDVKAALALIRPALRALSAERAGHAMRADGSGVQAIMPRTPGEAFDYARDLVTVGHVPQAYRIDGKAANEPVLGLVALGIMKAMEVGLPPQTGLAQIMPVNDRFTVWGDGAQALVARNGVIAAQGKTFGLILPDRSDVQRDEAGRPVLPEGFTAAAELTKQASDMWPDNLGWHVWFERRGEVGRYQHAYTVGDARRANLWMHPYKKPWLSDPLRMLFNRARAFALRDGFADCLLGLTIREEYDDYADAAPAPGRARVDTSKRLTGGFDDPPALEHHKTDPASTTSEAANGST